MRMSFEVEPLARQAGWSAFIVDLLVIGLFAVLAAAAVLGMIDDVPWRLHIENDRGIVGLWGYLKWVAITGVLLLLWMRRGGPVFLGLAGVFFILLIDDALEVHERLGTFITVSAGFSDTLALRGQDFGELVSFGALGLLVLSVFGPAYLASDSDARRQALWFLALVGLLAVFGVGADMLHIAAIRLTDGLTEAILGPLIAVIEDGGELLVATAILIYAVHLCAQARLQPQGLA